MALRVMPTVGAEVRVEHLGADEPGVVRHVDPDGRGVEVELAGGRRQRFALNRATARFTAGGQLTGERLHFVQPSPGD